MKRLKVFGAALLCAPLALFMLFMLFVFYEIFGMCANRVAARAQTATARAHLKSEIPDVEIVRVTSETGNSSGTGNHVECISSVTFATRMTQAEIAERMSKHYALGEGCTVSAADDGVFTLLIVTAAPFADNIEGH